MDRIALLILVAAATGLGGCTSVLGPTPAPSCDGGARRPINRSMWDWEAARPGTARPGPVASATDPAPEARSTGSPMPAVHKDGALAPRQRPAFDLAGSLRPCVGRIDHG